MTTEMYERLTISDHWILRYWNPGLPGFVRMVTDGQSEEDSEKYVQALLQYCWTKKEPPGVFITVTIN